MRLSLPARRDHPNGAGSHSNPRATSRQATAYRTSTPIRRLWLTAGRKPISVRLLELQFVTPIQSSVWVSAVLVRRSERRRLWRLDRLLLRALRALLGQALD